MTTCTALDRFVERASELYSLPAVAVRVLDLTAEPQVDLRALKSCIENDPALAAKVLRVVNSSLFGLSSEVRDLGQALALLGIKPLKLLVLGFSLSAAICPNVEGSAVKRYWQHTLTQAIAARELSERIWRSPGDEAFLAALLQDIGMLVLIQELGDPYVRFLDRALATEREIAPLEKSVLNFDYRELGARLLDRWALPGSLVGSINLRLRPEAIGFLTEAEQALPRILRLAERLADLMIDRRHAALEELLSEPARRQSLSVSEVEELITAIEQKVGQLANLFSCELPPGVDYRDVLVEAHRRMSRLATEVAGDLIHSSAAAAASVAEDVELMADMKELTVVAAEFERVGRLKSDGDVGSQPSVTVSATAVATTVAAPPAAVAVTRRSAPASVGNALSVEMRTQVARALVDCRQGRQALSLVLVEIDHFASLVRTLGPVAAEQRVAELGQICGDSCDLPGATLLQARQACFALVLPDCDRGEAVGVADDILHRVREEPGQRPGSVGLGVSVSVGVATVPLPPKNFRVDDLIDSASRCLSTAQLSGGNTLKSIGVY
ncbi:MAG TPA: HDOD domain-containing protein [Pirellulales bacterium]|jgi:HD-like signal output (HDOD) protein/GGDEF domain-containing protein|nr:HDOD domain-containing protein [Pirellulales bacterium]